MAAGLPDDVAEMCARVANIAEDPNATELTRNRHRRTFLVQCGTHLALVKAYAPPARAARWRALLRGPAGRREWRWACRFYRDGFPVPRPWAFADGGRTGPSWFVQEGLPDAVHLLAAYDRWFARWTSAPAREAWPALADRIGRLAAELHRAGIDHPDLHPGNLLCTGTAPDSLRLHLVDYHSVRRGVGPPEWYRRRNLAKLVHGLAQSMPRTDVADVLNAYLHHRDGVAPSAPMRDARLAQLYRDAEALERRRLRRRGGARLLSDA